MALPKTIAEWREVSPTWRQRAQALLPPEGYPGKRLRPRDPDEARALRKLGLDRQRPFSPLRESEDAALQIRKARSRSGISQAELAQRLGVSQQQVQRLEDPEKSNPTIATLRSVAAALGTQVTIRLDSHKAEMPAER